VLENRTHNAVHELLTRNASALTYEPKGSLATDNFEAKSYTWDFDNQMASASVVSTGLTTAFTYDALGRRVSKTTGGTTTAFVTALNQEIAEYGGGALPANPTRVYVFGTYVDEPLAMVSGGTTLYYHANSLYCVAAMTDHTGSVQERYVYNPYGKVTILDPTGTVVRATSSVGNALSYTGRRLDAETALYYYRARYYDPGQGRFIGRDPAEGVTEPVISGHSRLSPDVDASAGQDFRYLENLALYEFEGGNPTDSIDPTGEYFYTYPGGGPTIWVTKGQDPPRKPPPPPAPPPPDPTDQPCNPTAANIICKCHVGTSFGIGYHAYLYSSGANPPKTYNSQGESGCCGIGGNGGGPGPVKDSCKKVVHADGSDLTAAEMKAIMDCITATKNNGLWIPFATDCHNRVNNCITAHGGVVPPGVGRF